MNTHNTVLVMSDTRYQPQGLWIFVNDYDVVKNILTDYMPFNDADNNIEDFISKLDAYPMCDIAAQELSKNGRDGYLNEWPAEWL